MGFLTKENHYYAKNEDSYQNGNIFWLYIVIFKNKIAVYVKFK